MAQNAHPAPHAHASDHRQADSAPHAHASDHRHADSAPHDAAHQHRLAEVLDLDARLFASYLTTVTGRLACLAGGEVKDIVDIGAGTGAGTFALLEQFPTARVTAVDSSAAMLAGLAEAAAERGLGDRVRTLEADAAHGLPGITDADLVWASASLHHVDDPAAALAGIHAALRPGGLLAVAELDGMPRFLPDDAVPDRPALEARCREALDALQAEHVPHLGADWGGRLTAAGFTVEQERTERLELRAPLPDGVGRYAYLTLSGIRGRLDGLVEPADLAALDALLDGGPADVRRRDDLVVRSTRQLWVARRPEADSR
ncbi:class I SAM-dependent methyltransferase [Streptomyces sp. NPDC050658]|uniref:class I SAM-dependent methyltransferase n=1 Tax=unclassified Streptomyces TaxID=2593676 RepID=UPI0034370A4C